MLINSSIVAEHDKWVDYSISSFFIGRSKSNMVYPVSKLTNIIHSIGRVKNPHNPGLLSNSLLSLGRRKLLDILNQAPIH
ncbi:hypothetical protein QVD17_22014 [Tagetes erecta]|uniref:Uncharacterized protein n=1 Tax=Tagetes erecta TaxID=13708 RepID=A0AAD8KD12_TARER|nr:hypothetical protein QVD17_22014 [Tagetes erecta]